MSALSNYLENKILDHIIGGVQYAPPEKLYIGLFKTFISDASVGTEVSGGGYQRVEVLNNAQNWQDSINGSKKNKTLIQFPAATLAWGTVVSVGIFDELGNLLFHSQISQRPVLAGDVLGFPVGAISFNLD